MPSRLSMLWATAEELFGGKPQPLLSKEEIKTLIEAVDQIKSIKQDKKKYERVKRVIEDPQFISEKSRNEMMASNIAQYLSIQEDEALIKVKKASIVRGKNVHQIRRDWREIKESEDFLRNAIISFINKKTRELVK